MAGYRGYNNYRGRTSKGKTVLAVVLVLVILASIGFIMLQEYIVYDETGTPHLMLPQKEAEEQPLLEEDEELNLTIQSSQKRLVTHGFTVAEAPLTEEGWRLAWTAAPEGYNAAAVTMKTEKGTVCFDAQTAVDGARKTKTDTAPTILEMLQGDTAVEYAIARFSCFHDSIAANRDVEGMGLKNTGGFIFYDGSNTQWLDPAKEQARAYLCSLAVELAELGFDEIILTDVSYPTEGKLDKIDYGDSVKARNLETFLREMAAALEPYEIKLALQLSETVMIEGSDNAAGIILADLAPLVDRIYAETTPEQVEELAAVVARAAENTEFVPILPADSAPIEGSYLLQ